MDASKCKLRSLNPLYSEAATTEDLVSEQTIIAYRPGASSTNRFALMTVLRGFQPGRKTRNYDAAFYCNFGHRAWDLAWIPPHQLGLAPNESNEWEPVIPVVVNEKGIRGLYSRMLEFNTPLDNDAASVLREVYSRFF